MRTGLAKVMAIAAALLLIAAAPAFDPKPWLEDFDQAQAAFSSKYANFEWAVFQREADLTALFADTRARIAAAGSDAEAKAAFDRRLGDGHVAFHWPAASKAATTPPADPCAALGYDGGMSGRPLATHLSGYSPLPGAAPEFPAGTIGKGKRTIGVIKIGLFSPLGAPELCKAGLRALGLAASAPCDDRCSDRVERWAAARMTEDFKQTLEALKKAGGQTLLVDIAQNGGGSEWADAAAQMVTGVRFQQERLAFVRGPHWVKKWGELPADLRKAAATAPIGDQAKLATFAQQADAKAKIAATPCSSAAFWRGERPSCDWLGEGGYATGLMSEADAATYRSRPWASLVFTPAEFPYRDGIWSGPLIVLVDEDTASASEEFAAVLQDSHAAVILGAPTAGAGCGHTDGGTPTTLAHSGGVLVLPDCVRLRPNGENEVVGVQPDVLVGLRGFDGVGRQAALVQAKLGQAERLAAALWRRNRAFVAQASLNHRVKAAPDRLDASGSRL